MALGTTVRPLDGPHDLDFVFELDLSHVLVDPMRLLREFYGFLKGHGVYRDLVSLKNRCVRLTYANDFYMDVLPACRDNSLGGTCIQVPDRQLAGWSPSNPKGYVNWFRAVSAPRRRILMEKAAEPVPQQQEADDKAPLQLAVQLIKRWRDLHYDNDGLAPISIVLTSLAGHTYGSENSTSVALSAILGRVVSAIRAADLRGEHLVVLNPANQLEDLSERWDGNPEAYQAFRTGITQFHQDWLRTVNAGRETNVLLEALFGEHRSEGSRHSGPETPGGSKVELAWSSTRWHHRLGGTVGGPNEAEHLSWRGISIKGRNGSRSANRIGG